MGETKRLVLLRSASAQTMETLSKSAIMKNLANRKQYVYFERENHFYLNFVEKAVPYVLQSSEKKKKTESTKYGVI